MAVGNIPNWPSTLYGGITAEYRGGGGTGGYSDSSLQGKDKCGDDETSLRGSFFAPNLPRDTDLRHDCDDCMSAENGGISVVGKTSSVPRGELLARLAEPSKSRDAPFFFLCFVRCFFCEYRDSVVSCPLCSSIVSPEGDVDFRTEGG
ncbi:MAG: hypothetical protein LBS23_03085, partial [Holosporaceae bacterium]|nr:hypothetical protein [Holosporaceae bacterium]